MLDSDWLEGCRLDLDWVSVRGQVLGEREREGAGQGWQPAPARWYLPLPTPHGYWWNTRKQKFRHYGGSSLD